MRVEAPFLIRPIRPGDRRRLHAIDRAASRLFATVPIAEIAAIALGPHPDFEIFVPILDDGPVFVACDTEDSPVGFAAALPISNFLYLRELSVHPDYQRRGTGTALLKTVIEHGRHIGAEACALSTFRDVAFNAPFYAKSGFTELPLAEAPTVLRRRFEAEIPSGIAPELRVLMIRAG